MEDKKYLYEILVPTGYPFIHHMKWDDEVKKISSGLTILKPVKGKWVDSINRSVDEYMIPVQIRCTEKEIVEIATFTLLHYKQEAVMFYRISNECYIIRKDEMGGCTELMDYQV